MESDHFKQRTPAFESFPRSAWEHISHRFAVKRCGQPRCAIFNAERRRLHSHSEPFDVAQDRRGNDNHYPPLKPHHQIQAHQILNVALEQIRRIAFHVPALVCRLTMQLERHPLPLSRSTRFSRRRNDPGMPNGHGKYAAPDNETRHARFPLPNPLPQAGEGANESLREFHVKKTGA